MGQGRKQRQLGLDPRILGQHPKYLWDLWSERVTLLLKMVTEEGSLCPSSPSPTDWRGCSCSGCRRARGGGTQPDRLVGPHGSGRSLEPHTGVSQPPSPTSVCASSGPHWLSFQWVPAYPPISEKSPVLD